MTHALLIIGAALFTLGAYVFAEFSGFCLAHGAADSEMSRAVGLARVFATLLGLLAAACLRAA